MSIHFILIKATCEFITISPDVDSLPMFIAVYNVSCVFFSVGKICSMNPEKFFMNPFSL